jgi:SWI/SNF-related matrix-associated actin-dependent regulator 1 of chromatin subfamily A
MGYIANSYVPTTIKRASLYNGTRVHIDFKCSRQEFQPLLEAVRGIPGRAFDMATKTWNAPLNQYTVDALEALGFDVDENIVKWKELQGKGINLNFPKGLSLYEFQKQGLTELVRLDGRALLADEMGLGKTIQAIAYMALNLDQRGAIVVVPASLKLNWEREIKKWMPREKIQVVFGCGKQLTGDIIIINYDILGKYTDAIRAYNPALIILDECHMVKNLKAKRTKAVRDICKGVKHIIALSGTPIVNRPIEFYSTLSLLAPQMFNSYYRFAQEFCSPETNRFGTTYKGSSNTEKLNEILKKSFMIRRLKKDVLKDLPPKVRTVVPIDIENRAEYNEAEEDLIAWLESIGEDEKAERAARAEAIVKTNALKQLVAKGKMSAACEWIENFIQEEKLVVFCIHHATIDLLMERFGDRAVKLDGRDKPEDRQRAVDEFQGNEDVRLFVGNIKAAGTGITLHAASATAFVEMGWTSSDHDQAEDRVHRIGQMSDSVNAYYLLGADTIEEEIAGLIDKKRTVLDAVLDGHVTEEEAMIAELMKKLRRK